MSFYSEQETEAYYDAEDDIYRSLWDEDGSVHFGVFDEATGNDFLKAGANLNRLMLEKSGISTDSTVLDLGCGNGTTAIWLSRTTGCTAKGVDLSGVRAQNAREKRNQLPPALQARVGFEKASATELPFADDQFSHVWSQAVIYHIPEKAKALHEVHRVLAGGGIFVFDDLFKPQPQISSEGRKYVYDRLLFDTEYDLPGYQAALESVGFEVIEANDMTTHLQTSYTCLAEMASRKKGEHKARFAELALAYRETVKAIRRNELGWGIIICKKRVQKR